ncbi:MAG TPA: EAL domain-containing protein, partial [Burkholderiaceae bacterium]|nr:EAL domain-containing protein [Burkholderiaceae bacterium]
AEDSGLIIDLGEWVIRHACADIRNWLDNGLENVRVAINISSRQFQDPLLTNKISNAMTEAQITPEMLCLEVTETVIMQDTLLCTNTLEEFKKLNLNLTLDDFGTGFSSLSYLKRFPFHKVKIDRSFIKNVMTNPDDAAISKAIISMAHSFGIRVVAEGVETEAQCSFLSQNMCDEIQGFLFSSALDTNEVGDILRQGRCLPENLLRFQKPQRTLLLVDDEQNIISALKRLLRGGDFQILTANSGQGGLDILSQHAVDVIVSDQRMPGMTGVEFLGIAKELYPETVRIVLSGYTELHSVTDAVNEGAIYKFLTKPWDDDQLRGHIEEAFRRKEMADENQRLNLEVRAANQDLATANRRLEEILQQKQQQINRDEVSLDIVREALQQVPLAIIGVDDDDMVVFANDAAQILFDNTASILGNDVNHLIPDLAISTPDSRKARSCTVELNDVLYNVISRRMGSGSQSRGKLMTLSPFEEKA